MIYVIQRIQVKPYLAKIAWTRKPVIIADCFAGKGRFDDGQAGSPLLILDAVDQQLKTTPDVRIKSIFIEKKYFSDLEANVGVRDNAYLLEGSYVLIKNQISNRCWFA